MPVPDTTREAARALVQRYPVARSALLPLLHLVQAEHGYVSDEGIAFCAESLGLTKAEVGAVATFYTMFKREPVGDYLLSVCTNPTCKIAGAQDIYDGYVEQLGGHRDADDGVSVEHAECLGICDAAPVVQVNYEMFGPLTKEQADELLAACRKGSPPASNWSNEVPRTFREVEFELSGAGDGVDDLLAAAARAQVEAEVPPTYRSGETDIPVTHPGGDPKGIGGQVLRERVAGGAEAEPSTHGAPDVAGGAEAEPSTDGAPDVAGGAEAEPSTHGAPDVAGGAEAEPSTHGAPDASGAGAESGPEELDDDRVAAAETPHIAEEADAGEKAASTDVAGEQRGVAEERSDQASDPTPPTPASDDTPPAPPAGEMPPEAAGDTPTATEQSQVARKVSSPETAQTVQGGPETRTPQGQAEADRDDVARDGDDEERS